MPSADLKKESITFNYREAGGEGKDQSRKRGKTGKFLKKLQVIGS